MTTAIFLFISLLSTTFLAATPRETVAKPHACSFFTYANAEKLLGQKVSGADTDETSENGSRRWGCTFSTASGEASPRLLFLLIRDPNEETARTEFEKIRISNQKHPGFEEWAGVGDEAIVHTDGENFQFLMVRRGSNTIRIKVRRSKTISLEDVKAVTASVAAKLK